MPKSHMMGQAQIPTMRMISMATVRSLKKGWRVLTTRVRESVKKKFV